MKLPDFESPSGDSSSKIGRHFSNKVVLKLKSAKNAFYKNGAQYLTNCHRIETQNLVISFDYSWFLAKNLAF